MDITNKVVVVTGAASGIGNAIAAELHNRHAKVVAFVDSNPKVSDCHWSLLQENGSVAFCGDVTDENFRKKVFDDLINNYGVPSICVPAAGITQDSLAVKIDKETNKVNIYPQKLFEQVIDINLIASSYWAIELIARAAENKTNGVIVFIGSVSSHGNRGQVSYAASKCGLIAITDTLNHEGQKFGVRCLIVHPGYTNTPMVAAVPKEILEKKILPNTQLKRLVEPEEVASAVIFAIENDAVSREIWVDAGWHPTP